MAALTAELEFERARAVTAERALIECIRIMSHDQFEELKATFRFMDSLGGISNGPGS